MKLLYRNRCKAVVFFVLCLISVFLTIHLVSVNVSKASILEIYQLANNTQVYGIFNVCIEPLLEPVVLNKYEITFNVTQRIVIYDAVVHKHYSNSFALEVSGPRGHPWNDFDVEFTSASLDPRRLQRGTAFFISSRCPGNLHHFIKENFLPLFSTIRSTGDLHPGADIWILYNTPNTKHRQFCRDYRRYDEILRTLHTGGFHDVYYNVPQNTCFSEAVFGSVDTLARSRDAIDQIIQGYNLSEICSAEKPKFVTIVLRKDRRILNIRELYRIANKTSHLRVQLVDFGGKSIRRQIEIACRSLVMIGANGAALEWGIFMPEGSLVLEIWWSNWPPFYADELKRYGIVHRTLEAEVVRTNWTTYEIRMRGGAALSSAERAGLFKTDRENVAKWSDVSVNVTKFREAFTNISESLVYLKDRGGPD